MVTSSRFEVNFCYHSIYRVIWFRLAAAGRKVSPILITKTHGEVMEQDEAHDDDNNEGRGGDDGSEDVHVHRQREHPLVGLVVQDWCWGHRSDFAKSWGSTPTVTPMVPPGSSVGVSTSVATLVSMRFFRA